MKIIQTPSRSDVKRGVDFTCVFYCHDGNGNILLNKRSQKCRDERGRWDCGGGALEFGEDFEAAARREIREEYCTEVIDLQFIDVRNMIRENDGVKTHWVAIIFAARIDKDKVAIGEPEKMDEIGWFPQDALPEPMHSMLYQNFEVVKQSGVFERQKTKTPQL